MAAKPGILTGYEPQFDFPMRDRPPEKPWLLATVPRTGSTFVSHLLWASGCLGAPLEYLNFVPAGPYGFASQSPAQQIELWRSALHRRTSPNGVFGLKAFPAQFEDLYPTNRMLVDEVMRTLFARGRPASVVHLRRRDTKAHAISYARALLSGIWRKEQEGEDRPEPEYSREALIRAARMIEHQESIWQAMFRDLRVAPLDIWYEDVLEDPEEAKSRVANYLGVEIDPAAAVTVPQIERQSRVGARAWDEASSRI